MTSTYSLLNMSYFPTNKSYLDPDEWDNWYPDNKI